MNLVRIFFVGTLTSALSLGAASAPQQKKSGNELYNEWYNLFCFESEYNGKTLMRDRAINALFKAAALSRIDLHIEECTKQNEIAEKQLEATCAQNKLLAQLLASIALTQPQATATALNIQAPTATTATAVPAASTSAANPTPSLVDHKSSK